MKKVFLLDDDRDLLEVMSGLIELSGPVECITALTFEEMREKQADALESICCFLDINLGHGQPSGVDAFRWLKSLGYTGKIFFLTGHFASNPQVSEAMGLQGTKVLSKPIDLVDLEAILGEAA